MRGYLNDSIFSIIKKHNANQHYATHEDKYMGIKAGDLSGLLKKLKHRKQNERQLLHSVLLRQ